MGVSFYYNHHNWVHNACLHAREHRSTLLDTLSHPYAGIINFHSREENIAANAVLLRVCLCMRDFHERIPN